MLDDLTAGENQKQDRVGDVHERPDGVVESCEEDLCGEADVE